jgi:DNA modification methylase
VEIKVPNPNNLPTLDYRKWIPLQGNLKDLSKANYNKLKQALTTHGYIVPAFLWRNPEDNSYYIIDAHQRHRVLLNEDMQPYELPYILIEAEDKQDAAQKLLTISSQYGTITQEGIDAFMATYELPELEMYEAVSFDALPYLGQSDEPEVEEDDPPEVSSEPAISKLGEIYELGEHRLMCSDSTDFGSVSDLMGGQLADMVFTDPPYGVDYQSRVDEKRRKGWGKIENDDLTGAKLQDFLALSLNNYGCSRYICSNWQSYIDFELALGKPNSLIVWDKGSIGLGAGYRNQHEFILFYGKLEHNSEQNVWTITRDNEYAHPTQKPLAISARAINNSSQEGEIVLDLFGGSGSTLIACEQLKRKCYMMELDPKYCDVIRKRYSAIINREDWQETTPVIT